MEPEHIRATYEDIHKLIRSTAERIKEFKPDILIAIGASGLWLHEYYMLICVGNTGGGQVYAFHILGVSYERSCAEDSSLPVSWYASTLH